jgi:iron complex outermembrane receptor protein/vitamin B12 transporter
MPYFKHDHTRRNFFYLLLLLSSFTLLAGAATVRGTITDSLGAVIPNARVELMSGSTPIASTTADGAGRYEFQAVSAGRYNIRATAPSFDWTASKPFYLGEGANANVDLLLAVGAISQTITVTATGTPIPQAQVGASVTLLSKDDYADKLDVPEALRLVPGAQLTQSGGRGGLGELFVRGGNSNANKVLIDDVPASDIGGAIDLGLLAVAGTDHIEVLRGPNSALYGAEALAGVVSINTPRGTTPLPEITYSVDGGNFGTYRQEGTLGGSHKQFDYFSDFSRFDTSNGAVRDSFHNGTLAGNVGWAPGPNTEFRATIRRLATAAGEPNAIQLFGIPE